MNCRWSAFGCLPDAAKQIRTEIFVREQGFDEEFDDMDMCSYHALLQRDGRDIGTARIFFEDDRQTMHIGRVAVLKSERGSGSGSILLSACEQKAKQLGAQRVILGAQCRAMKFYERNGFRAFGECFDDQGYPHRMMEKEL